MKHFYTSFLAALLLCNIAFAQGATLNIIAAKENISIRGLSVVSDKIIWCSGSKGSIARSIDGGKTFRWTTVAGYEQNDFRDIEAFDENKAVIMAIGAPSYILSTKDGGKSWQKVFEDSTDGMFLDAMAFDKKGNGIVIGDPINGMIYQAFTNDFGATWTKNNNAAKATKGESFFASSGTNIVATANKKQPYLLVSGGMVSRLFYNSSVLPLAMQKGHETTGANSVAYLKNKAVVVGGDFSKPNNSDSNCILVDLKRNAKCSKPIKAPLGYKSCVIFYNKNTLIACGTSGVDISNDVGLQWQNISKESFHVVQKAKKGKAIFLAGAKGRIATLVLD